MDNVHYIDICTNLKYNNADHNETVGIFPRPTDKINPMKIEMQIFSQSYSDCKYVSQLNIPKHIFFFKFSKSKYFDERNSNNHANILCQPI